MFRRFRHSYVIFVRDFGVNFFSSNILEMATEASKLRAKQKEVWGWGAAELLIREKYK